MSEPTNKHRAQWAKDALAVFTAETYSGDDPDTMDRGDFETAVTDLIADLLHLAHQTGFDPEHALDSARFHYEHELTKESAAEAQGRTQP